MGRFCRTRFKLDFLTCRHHVICMRWWRHQAYQCQRQYTGRLLSTHCSPLDGVRCSVAQDYDSTGNRQLSDVIYYTTTNRMTFYNIFYFTFPHNYWCWITRTGMLGVGSIRCLKVTSAVNLECKTCALVIAYDSNTMFKKLCLFWSQSNSRLILHLTISGRTKGWVKSLYVEIRTTQLILPDK